MCICPDGEFIAPFDIEAVKVVTGYRYSEVDPAFRAPPVGAPPAGFQYTGENLHYPPGEWVVSPSGPGIHCYHLQPGRNEIRYDKSKNHTTIRVTIPKGAKVFWEIVEVPGQNNATILAASEVLVMS